MFTNPQTGNLWFIGRMGEVTFDIEGEDLLNALLAWEYQTETYDVKFKLRESGSYPYITMVTEDGVTTVILPRKLDGEPYHVRTTMKPSRYIEERLYKAMKAADTHIMETLTEFNEPTELRALVTDETFVNSRPAAEHHLIKALRTIMQS